MEAKTRKRVRQLHRLVGSDNDGEATAARRKLVQLLRKHGKTWNDLDAILAMDVPPAQPPPDPRDTVADPYAHSWITPADTARAMLEDFIALEPHEYIAVALWIIHTHAPDRFMVSPRLLLTSPVRNCGKTTLLDVISRLVARPEKSDSITAAAIYHHVGQLRGTLLLDEADNLELGAKAALRAVLNAGHRKGGSVSRMVAGRPTTFSVFAPVALAAIGLVTLPLMSRSIVIRMKRHDGSRPLKRFDHADADAAATLDVVYRHIFQWLRHATLDPNPDMPAELRGRLADNWRPLISLADACSPAWGTLARDAAVIFARASHDEDPGIVLLYHLRAIFDAHNANRLASELLVKALIEHDELWSAWRGPRGDDRPRKLTQASLAELLRPFDIKPRKFWITRDPPKTARGYLRADLEAAWRAYCAEAGTPEHPSARKYLRSVPLE